ncbi:uncharacterized protein LOC120070682 [Benincasa hispida]|uniref:uncharacterized protein LOC120070682 n=1 Tax=Benincasa hispida TaxID=102211 RepID=UPI0019018DFD|nr:uncharacterized protein LOC120070682 [Benincasa hispida]
MDPSRAATGNRNKKRAASDEAGEAQGDCKRRVHELLDSYGFSTVVEDSIIKEGVKAFVDERWPEFEHKIRRQVSKDIEKKVQITFNALLPSPSKDEVRQLEGTRTDGAVHKNLSLFQGISENCMKIVGDFFDLYCQLGPTFLKEANDQLMENEAQVHSSKNFEVDEQN